MLCNECVYEPDWEDCAGNWQYDGVDIKKYGNCKFDKGFIHVSDGECWLRTSPKSAYILERCCARIGKTTNKSVYMKIIEDNIKKKE